MIARILHISDLHFSNNLSEKGRRLKKLWVLPGPNSHSFAKVDGLSLKVRELERAEGNIDLVLASGDISTDGSASSLSTALEFLEEPDGIYKGKPQRLKTMGLGAASARRLIVPGNHDRYAGAYEWPVKQQPSDELERVFGINKKYPYSVGFRRTDVQQTGGERAIIFFVFDSSLTEEGDSNFLYRIARGNIEPAQCRWLIEEARRITTNKKITGIDNSEMDVDYERSIKIVVLHHHPVVKGLDVSYDINAIQEAMDLTMMENSKIFVESCFDAGVDFILFGHQHLAYRGAINPDDWKGSKDWKPSSSAHTINYFCCPSTCEYKTHNEPNKRNGFQIFNFDEDQFNVQLFAWDDKSRGFALVSTSPLVAYPKGTRARRAGLK